MQLNPKQGKTAKHFNDSVTRYVKHLSKKMVTAKKKYDELSDSASLEALQEKYHSKYLDAKNEIAAVENGQQLMLDLKLVDDNVEPLKKAV